MVISLRTYFNPYDLGNREVFPMKNYQVTKRALVDITYVIRDMENEDEAIEAVAAGDYDAKEETVLETFDDFFDVQEI